MSYLGPVTVMLILKCGHELNLSEGVGACVRLQLRACEADLVRVRGGGLGTEQRARRSHR